MQEPAAFMLMYVVYPLWVAAGLLDWACHRRTGIAITSGGKENALHWLMYAEIGLGMLAVAFFEVNAALLAVVFAVFVVHEATVYWDLDYSTLKRDVGPFEQMVHSFLELLPLVSLALLALLADRAEWSLRARGEGWLTRYVLMAAGASVLFNLLPLLQETWSCAAANRRRETEPAGVRIEPKL
jgi:hypothetical protein